MRLETPVYATSARLQRRHPVGARSEAVGDVWGSVGRGSQRTGKLGGLVDDEVRG